MWLTKRDRLDILTRHPVTIQPASMDSKCFGCWKDIQRWEQLVMIPENYDKFYSGDAWSSVPYHIDCALEKLK